MYQKTVFISISNLELNINLLETIFPGIEEYIKFIDIHFYHELFFKKVEKINIKKSKKKIIKNKKMFKIGQMIKEIIHSRMLRNLDIWIVNSQNNQLLGKIVLKIINLLRFMYHKSF